MSKPLDPTPWVDKFGVRMHPYSWSGWVTFSPRPEYEQDRSKYPE